MALIHIYSVPVEVVAELLGPKARSVRRWYSLFPSTGVVNENKKQEKSSRWPEEVLIEVKKYPIRTVSVALTMSGSGCLLSGSDFQYAKVAISTRNKNPYPLFYRI